MGKCSGCARTQATTSKTFPAYSTTRSTQFTGTSEFRSAIEYAIRNGENVLIADINHLLSITKVEMMYQCVQDLHRADVKIVDAATGKDWKTLIESGLVKDAAEVSLNSSSTIKRGLKTGIVKSRSPDANRLLANASRRQKVDQRDEKLRAWVETWRAALKPGAKRSPTSLANYLNAAGLRTATGRLFSFGSSKSLLKRLNLDSPRSATS